MMHVVPSSNSQRCNTWCFQETLSVLHVLWYVVLIWVRYFTCWTCCFRAYFALLRKTSILFWHICFELNPCLSRTWQNTERYLITSDIQYLLSGFQWVSGIFWGVMCLWYVVENPILGLKFTQVQMLFYINYLQIRSKSDLFIFLL